MKALAGLAIGRYLPGESALHRLDPRVKIILVVAFVISAFLVKGYAGLGILGLFLVVLLGLAKVPAGWVFRGIRPLIYIVVFTLFIHALFTPGESLADLAVVTVTAEGLVNGLYVSVRLVLLVVGTSLLTFTTSPGELTDAIESLLTPLKRLGLPAHEVAMMMAIALRFIPTLLAETERIKKAQMARGADFEGRGFIRRAKSFLPLLIPLLISVFKRADDLAMAMEARCYRGGRGRSRLRRLVMRPEDWAATVVGLLALVVVVTFGRI